MKTGRVTSGCIVAGLILAASAAVAQKSKTEKKAAPAKNSASASSDWLLWGGPQRDFVTQSKGLASTWPANGPRKLWSRPLGDGYSAIAVDGTTLYTAYRRGAQDVVVALDARTGANIWEYAYGAPFTNAFSDGAGPGPYAMPQVVGDRIVTASGIGKIHSLDKKTGKPVWSHDLYAEFGGTQLEFGYSSHALPYKDNLIVLAGGRGSAVLALRQSDGAVVWKGLDFKNAHSSPLLIEVDGQPQVVALGGAEVIGFSPDDGRLLWRYAHSTNYGLAVSTPVWGPGNVLFISSAYGTGSKALHLQQSAGHTAVRELWRNNRLQAHFGSVIRDGEHVYFSSGHDGPPFMTCVNLRDGKVAWQERGFAKAQLLAADGKLILLDQDGNLALVQATPAKMQVLAQVPMLEKIAWTPPTLAGTKLFVRDRRNLMALDLAAK